MGNRESVKLGTIQIKPKWWVSKALQYLGLMDRTKDLIMLAPMGCYFEQEFLKALSDAKKIYGDPESEDSKVDIPLFYLGRVISIAMGLEGRKAEKIKDAIVQQWTDEQAVEAISIIKSKIDLSPFTQTMILLGKIPGYEDLTRQLLIKEIYRL